MNPDLTTEEKADLYDELVYQGKIKEKDMTQKIRGSCEGCGFYHPGERSECSIYSMACVNTPSRPSFRPEEDLIILQSRNIQPVLMPSIEVEYE